MRFRKFLKPYKTRDSSFREYTENKGGNSYVEEPYICHILDKRGK
jgi:hypothetical protein